MLQENQVFGKQDEDESMDKAFMCVSRQKQVMNPRAILAGCAKRRYRGTGQQGAHGEGSGLCRSWPSCPAQMLEERPRAELLQEDGLQRHGEPASSWQEALAKEVLTTWREGKSGRKKAELVALTDAT